MGVASLLSVLAVLVGLLAVPQSAAARGDTPSTGDPQDKVAQEVLDAFETQDTVGFWIRMAANADTSMARQAENWTARGQQVVDALKSTAASSQRQVRALLDSANVVYEPHWISNAIFVPKGTQKVLDAVVELPSVLKVRPNRTFAKPEPLNFARADFTTQAVEWGVANINADDVWNQLGVRGEGVTVSSIDSGVTFQHPALVEKYRGNNGDGTFTHDYNWQDTSAECDGAPCDGDNISSHGTHTMGTMVGDDGQGNQVGVAPAAEWMASNGCNTCSNADLAEASEWILEPTDSNGENPDVSKRPHIVNNSWGSRFPSTDPFLEDIQIAWADAGIFGVWSNGNSGVFGCESSGSPGSRTVNYSVGAYDENNQIADFSARGPGQDGEIKPSISAPGVDVRSSVEGGYGLISGTSMASPHVAGVVALMWSAAPALIGQIEETRRILNETARDVADDQCGGTPEDNNVWGEGRVDALAAVLASPIGDVGTLSGTVTDAASGAPIAGATVSANGDLDREVTTSADGTYSVQLTAGTYDVSASAFGFETATQTAEITADATTTLDFGLGAADRFTVTGTVTDSITGAPLPGTTVTIDGTGIPSVVTDANGAYTIPDVPTGSYEVTGTAGACTTPTTVPLTVDGPETLDFALEHRTDSFGYFCGIEPSGYVAASDPLALEGDDNDAEVPLPFAASLYGQRYETAFVTTNGHVNFLERNDSLVNDPLPEEDEPNAALYPLWDDVVVDDEAAMFTQTIGQAPNRRFVIEWRNVTFFGDRDQRVDFEVWLHESGDITFSYRNIDPTLDRESGESATVGIENETGTVAFQYSFEEPALTNGLQIRFQLPPNGLVTGTVTDANDGGPIAGATVQAIASDGTVAREAVTGEDGTYSTLLFFGGYTIQVSAPNYVTSSSDVVINVDGELNTVDAALRTGVADVAHADLRWILTEGETRGGQMSVGNTGSADLVFALAEEPDAPWLSASPENGVLAPGASSDIALSVDTTGLAPGVHTTTLLVETNAGRVPVVEVPVTVVLSAFRVGVDAGGGGLTDAAGDTWQADQQYTPGDWGWVAQRSTDSSTNRRIGGTTEDGLFQTRRSGIFSYRFDNLPAGTYQIELGFAEFRRLFMPGRRVFDVSANGQFLLVGHDVAAEVRGLWADQHSFTIEHNGGDLELTFHDRFGFRLPIVNTLRVTHRPDL